MGEKWGFMGKVDMSCKVVRSEGMGLKRDSKLCGKIYYKLHTVLSYSTFLLGVLPFVHVVS